MRSVLSFYGKKGLIATSTVRPGKRRKTMGGMASRKMKNARCGRGTVHTGRLRGTSRAVHHNSG